MNAGSAKPYTGSIKLNASTCVKTRTLSGSTWSALNEAVFAVGPVARSLRISEIMYHPAESGNPDDPNTEFIELTNIGDESINLNLVKLSNGVEFTFQDFHEPILIKPGNAAILQANCLRCHGDHRSHALRGLRGHDVAASRLVPEICRRMPWVRSRFMPSGHGVSCAGMDRDLCL